MKNSGTLAFAIVATTLSVTAIVAQGPEGPNAAVAAENAVERPSAAPMSLVLLDSTVTESRPR